MGTINYFTSDYITLAIKPYEADDYTKDDDFMNFIRDEWDVDTKDENAVYEAVNEQMQEDYSCDRENAESIINKYDLYYFHVAVKSGYYEGYSIDIEANFGIFYDDYKEKAEAQKEITQIKGLLTELAGCGYVSCAPGWVTTFKDYKGTLKDINNAIREMREEVRNTPTWRNYNLATA